MFQGSCHALSLLFCVEWELLIREIQIIKFYWSENEGTLYFSFQSSLETSWDKQIEILLLECLIRFVFVFHWLVISFSLALFGLSLSLLGCLNSLQFFVLETLFKGISGIIKLLLLIVVLCETSSVELSELRADVLVILGLETVLETLENPFVSRIVGFQIQNTVKIGQIVSNCWGFFVIFVWN